MIIIANDNCEKWTDEKSSWVGVSFCANLHSRRIRWSSSWNNAKTSQGYSSRLPTDSITVLIQEKAAWEAQQPTVDPYREMTEQEEEIQRRKDQRMDEHRDYVRRGDGNRKNMG